MRKNVPWPQPVQSVVAVVVGFFVTAALSVATDMLLHAVQAFPKWGEPMSDMSYALAATYRAAFTVLGGFTTARLAPNKPMVHVWTLAYLGIFAGTAAAVSTWNAGSLFGPHWYPVALVVMALPCVLLGGRLAATAHSRAADAARGA